MLIEVQGGFVRCVIKAEEISVTELDLADPTHLSVSLNSNH